jgi:prophage regulatory protein
MKRSRTAVEQPRPQPERFLTRREVMDRVGLTYVTIWRWMKDGQFPQARRIGTRRLRWCESDIAAWIASRPVHQLDGEPE